jgi:hypothetical protein
VREIDIAIRADNDGQRRIASLVHNPEAHAKMYLSNRTEFDQIGGKEPDNKAIRMLISLRSATFALICFVLKQTQHGMHSLRSSSFLNTALLL